MNILTYLQKNIRDMFSTKTEHAASDVKKYIDCYETIKVLVQSHRPENLCDIGAHNGTWSYTLSLMDKDLKTVVCFEPQKEAFKILKKWKFPRVRKYCYPFGLGKRKSTAYMYGGTSSASLLKEKDQQAIFPNSLRDQKEKVRILRLDDIYKKDNLPYPDTIKIDVQGYELCVLEGGKDVLSHARYLVIELSFREFYKGQPSLSSVLSFLEKHHYEFVDFGYQWRSEHNDVVQIDGIFRNTKYNI